MGLSAAIEMGGALVSSFFELLLIILAVFLVGLLVYFFADRRAILTKMLHQPKKCLECQALRQMARTMAGEGSVRALMERFFLRDVDGMNGELMVSWYGKGCTISLIKDGITHRGSYDAKDLAPDGGEEVHPRPAA